MDDKQTEGNVEMNEPKKPETGANGEQTTSKTKEAYVKAKHKAGIYSRKVTDWFRNIGGADKEEEKKN